MVDDLRTRVIDRGLEKGYRASEINAALKQLKLPSYNPLTYTKNYINLPSNIGKDLKEMGAGLRTIGGEIIKPVVQTGNEIYSSKDKLGAAKKAFSKAVNDPKLRNLAKYTGAGAVAGSLLGPVGTLGGAILGASVSAAGGPKNFANSVLSTYGTNVDEIAQGNVDLQNVAQGIMTNPVYTAMDLSPIYAKPLKGAISKVGNVVKKDSPLALQAVLPSKELREFNRQLSQYQVGAKAKQASKYGAYNELSARINLNRPEVVRHLAYNTGKLSGKDLRLANALKKDLIANEKQAIALGLLDKDYARNNTVAQYVMGNIMDETPLIHKDIMDLLQGGELRPIAKNILSDSNNYKTITDLVKKANKLYDEDKIAYVTQKLAGESDPLGDIKASDLVDYKGDYFDLARVIGRTKPERLGKVLDDSIKFQLDQVATSGEALDTLNSILNNKEVTGMLDMDIKSNITKKFKDSIAKNMMEGKAPDLGTAMRNSGLAYKVDKIYGEAIKNAFKGSPRTPYRLFSNAFKKAVLANPHWIALNRIGNWTNNAMEGVTLADYLDTVGKYRKLEPKQLKQQTSFSSYINEGIEGTPTVPISTMTQPINKAIRTVERFRSSGKKLEDIGNLLGGVYSNTSDITANPLFRAEAHMELTDRYANFIRQAKRLSKETKESVESILKRSNEDNELFAILNNEVDKSLGDYVGRNYAIPKAVYDTLGELVPFYRFLTQTGRTTLHQLTNRPLAFQSMVGMPARAGQDKYYEYMKKFGLDPEKYKGGVPYKNVDGNIRTLGFEPLPAGAVGEQMVDFLRGEDSGILTPLWNMGHDIYNYKKGDRTPTSPDLVRAKLRGEDTTKYKPSQLERKAYALHTLLNTTYNPYIMGTRYFPEILATIEGTGLQSNFDTGPYIVKDKKTGKLKEVRNPLSYKKLTPEELVGRWIGIQTQSNFPQNENKSKRKIKQEKRRAMWAKKRMIQNSSRKLGDE